MRALTIRFGGTVALDGVSLSAAEGEILGIIALFPKLSVLDEEKANHAHARDWTGPGSPETRLRR